MWPDFIEKSIGENDCVAHDGDGKVDRRKNPFGPMRHEVVGSGSVECLSNSLEVAFHAGIGHPAVHRQQCRATGAKQGDQRQKGFHGSGETKSLGKHRLSLPAMHGVAGRLEFYQKWRVRATFSTTSARLAGPSRGLLDLPFCFVPFEDRCSPLFESEITLIQYIFLPLRHFDLSGACCDLGPDRFESAAPIAVCR
jgi:hypothetical protein